MPSPVALDPDGVFALSGLQEGALGHLLPVLDGRRGGGALFLAQPAARTVGARRVGWLGLFLTEEFHQEPLEHGPFGPFHVPGVAALAGFAISGRLGLGRRVAGANHLGDVMAADGGA